MLTITWKITIRTKMWGTDARDVVAPTADRAIDKAVRCWRRDGIRVQRRHVRQVEILAEAE